MILEQNNNEQYSNVEYKLYCDTLESQFKEAKENGLFQILQVLELDDAHSDSSLVSAVNYFKKNNGVIESDAPFDFLSARDKKVVGNGVDFRPKLYAMLLSSAFSEAIQNKSAFISGSFKYAFNSHAENLS